MSFSLDTKIELSHIRPEKKCCMLAEIAGFIRMCGSIQLAGGGKFNLVMMTEHAAIARHFETLVGDYFSQKCLIEEGPAPGIRKATAYYLTLGPDQNSEAILRETGMLLFKEGMNYITDGIYDQIIKTKCCRKAYLRGIFLAAGTMSDPARGYHFEINCSSHRLALDVRRLINSFTDIHSKIVERKSGQAVYVKEQARIADILAIMGAGSQYFRFQDIVIQKEALNAANRLFNCDNANLDRALAAAARQLAAIDKIDSKYGLDSLPDKLRVVALLRRENPDASLATLGEMMDPPMKKSGINKRISKLLEMAESL